MGLLSDQSHRSDDAPGSQRSRRGAVRGGAHAGMHRPYHLPALCYHTKPFGDTVYCVHSRRHLQRRDASALSPSFTRRQGEHDPNGGAPSTLRRTLWHCRRADGDQLSEGGSLPTQISKQSSGPSADPFGADSPFSGDWALQLRDLSFVKRPDGSDMLLGAGSYGNVRQCSDPAF